MRRKIVVPALKRLDAVSVENPAHPGTPDVNYLHGWIELKRIERWPPRKGPVRVPHFSKEQRIWLRRRWGSGGEAYLLLLVEETHEWLLFDGQTAATLVGSTPEAQLRPRAVASWVGNARLMEELEGCLSTRATLRSANA